MVEIIVMASRGQCQARHFPAAGEALSQPSRAPWLVSEFGIHSLQTFLSNGNEW